jgi:phosphonate transport system substrate-binding protein
LNERISIVLAYSAVKDTRHILSLLFAVVLVFTQGCSSEGDVAIVDFGKTISMEKPGERPSDSPELKVAVAAMISPKETSIYYRQILDYIGQKSNQHVQLIQRKTYEELNALFGSNQIDLAFICSGPYATRKAEYGFDALATPLVRGEPFYQSYLIVGKNSSFQTLEDLRGRVFAFTDPGSNTGKLVPSYWLAQMGKRPENFFEKTIFTYSHDNSILAVARGLVDGAAVDSHIWEYYNKTNPLYTSKTRVIKKSAPYGNPPLVASAQMPAARKAHIRQLLVSMHLNPDGKKILDELMIDRFVEPEEIWYDPIRQMQETAALTEETARANAKP